MDVIIYKKNYILDIEWLSPSLDLEPIISYTNEYWLIIGQSGFWIVPSILCNDLDQFAWVFFFYMITNIHPFPLAIWLTTLTINCVHTILDDGCSLSFHNTIALPKAFWIAFLIRLLESHKNILLLCEIDSSICNLLLFDCHYFNMYQSINSINTKESSKWLHCS